MRFPKGEARTVLVFEIVYNSLHRALTTLQVDGLSAHASDQILDFLLKTEKAVAALKLLLADRAAETSSWRSRGARSAADDLAKRTGTSKRQAEDVLDTAKRVKEQPLVEDALRGGDLSHQQASMISDAAKANPGATGSLLKKAKVESLGGLKDACGKAKAAADPDEDTTQRRIHGQRRFRTGYDTEGAFIGSFRMTKRDGTTFTSLFQPFHDAAFIAAKAEGRREPAEAYAVDALLAMARAAHANTAARDGEGPTPVSTVKPPAHVNVVVNWDALMGRHAPDQETAYIAGLGAVPVSLAREIMENAFLTVAVMKSNEVAKIKRVGRSIPAELHDALMIRSGFRCSTPGCNNWARLERDHVHPYAKGGETSYDNLEPKCEPCHDEKTRQDRILWDDTG
jgi:hypothetical protein